MEMMIDVFSLFVLSAICICALFLFAIPVSLVVGGMFCATAFIEEFLLHHPNAHKTEQEPIGLNVVPDEMSRTIHLKNVA